MVQTVKNLSAMQETLVQSLGREDPLKKGMAIHSSILAWRVPCTEEPGRLQSMGVSESQKRLSTLSLCTLAIFELFQLFLQHPSAGHLSHCLTCALGCRLLTNSFLFYFLKLKFRS